MRFRRGFTLIELLVVLAIIVLLVSILLPALGAAKALARQVQCQANQRSIGQAMMAYTVDEQDALPYAGVRTSASSQVSFDDVLSGYLQHALSTAQQQQRYLDSDQPNPVFICPEDVAPEAVGSARSYAMIQAGAATGSDRPAGTGLLYVFYRTSSPFFSPPVRDPRPVSISADIPAASGTLLLGEVSCEGMPLPFMWGNIQGEADKFCVLDSPAEQVPGNSFKGRKVRLLHGTADAPTGSYLYADGHVGHHVPLTTVSAAGAGGEPDGAWTRDPTD